MDSYLRFKEAVEQIIGSSGITVQEFYQILSIDGVKLEQAKKDLRADLQAILRDRGVHKPVYVSLRPKVKRVSIGFGNKLVLFPIRARVLEDKVVRIIGVLPLEMLINSVSKFN